MNKTIKAEHIRALLNNRNTPILYITQIMKQYFLQPEIKNTLLNKLRKYYLNSKTKNIMKWFIEEYEELVINTKVCSTKYSAQILLKTVWQMLSSIQQELIYNINNNIILEEPDKKPLTREERLKKQAALMRAAKAKKREERLAKESKNKI